MGTRSLAIGDAKVAFLLARHSEPIFQGTVIIPQVQLSGGAHPGEYALLVAHSGIVSVR